MSKPEKKTKVWIGGVEFEAEQVDITLSHKAEGPDLLAPLMAVAAELGCFYCQILRFRGQCEGYHSRESMDN